MLTPLFLKMRLLYKFLFGTPENLEYPDENNPYEAGVLIILYPQFHASDVGVELGYINQQTVNQELKRIVEIREWLKSQTDPKLVKAYNGWLDYYERQCHHAQKAIDNHAREKWVAECKQDMINYQRKTKFAATLPAPPRGKND